MSMTQEPKKKYNKKISLAFPNSSQTIETIDQVRGSMSRSKAVKKLLDYVCQSPGNIRAVLGSNT